MDRISLQTLPYRFDQSFSSFKPLQFDILMGNNINELNAYAKKMSTQAWIEGRSHLYALLRKIKFSHEVMPVLQKKQENFHERSPMEQRNIIDTENYGKVQKKIKIDGISSTSTQDSGEFLEKNIQEKKFEGGLNDQGKRMKKKHVTHFHKKVQVEKSTHPRTIEGIVFSHEKKKILFNVESKGNEHKIERNYMTKEEVLREDPFMLLYFYEKHLQFTKSTDFRSNDLKKVNQ